MSEKKNRILPFLAITFVSSWSLGIGYWLLGGRWNTPPAFVVGTIYMFTPLLAAVIVQKWSAHEPIRIPLSVFFRPNRWFVVAWLLPVGIAFGAAGVSLLFPGVEFSPDLEGFYERLANTLSQEQVEKARQQMDFGPLAVFGITLAQTLVAAGTINAVAGFGEELGWRGLLYEELKHLGFWRCSLLTGAIWGVWHAPIIAQGHNYQGNPVVNIVMMTLFCMAWAPLFTIIRQKSGSVIGASILHGSINASAGLSLIFLRGGDTRIVGTVGIAGILTVGLVTAALYPLIRNNTLNKMR
jgi:membrane protease YdiL (CAAX protease family)